MCKQFVLWITSVSIATCLSTAGWALPSVQGAASPNAATAPATTETAATDLSVILGLSYLGLDVDGNVRRYEQYVTPPHGGFLGDLELRQSQPTGNYLDLGLRDVDQPSFNGDIWSLLNGGNTIVSGQYRRSRFFLDLDDAADPLNRRDQSYDLVNRIGSGLFDLHYDDVVLSSDPSNDDNWVRSQAGVGYAVASKHGWVTRLQADKSAYSFQDASLFNDSVTTANASLSTPVSGRTAFEVNAGMDRTAVNDPIASSPQRLVLNLEGTQLLGSNLTLSGALDYSRLSDAIAQNAYARGDSGGEVRLAFEGLPHTDIEIGGGSRQVSYVNTIHTLVDQVPVNDVYIKAGTRISSRLRLKASAATWWSTDRPVAYDALGAPEGFSLVWSRKTDQRLEADYSLGPRSGLTGRLRRQTWSNADLATQNSLNEGDLFGWWMPTEKVTIYTSLLAQNFGFPATLGGSDFRTNARTGVVGATFQLAPRVALDLAYTDSANRGAEQADQHIITLGLNYQLKNGGKFSITASHDDYNNPAVLTPDLSYTGSWVEARYTFAAF
jgi:hypothetical protein